MVVIYHLLKRNFYLTIPLPFFSFLFPIIFPLNSFSLREMNAPLFYSYYTPDYSFSFINN